MDKPIRRSGRYAREIADGTHGYTIVMPVSFYRASRGSKFKWNYWMPAKYAPV